MDQVLMEPNGANGPNETRSDFEPIKCPHKITRIEEKPFLKCVDNDTHVTQRASNCGISNCDKYDQCLEDGTP